MRRPLEGIRVLDLTQAYSGPFCTMNLGDHGAEIIKIERGGGDQTRQWGPFKNDFSGYFAYINRNKKGITLNLQTEEGKEILRELIKSADVICSNYKVGVLEKLGFSYEDCKKINPRIIYGMISGFGLEGTWSKRPAYDIVAQAMSGMMSVTGFPDGPPCKIGPSVGDNYTGAYLCMGILMALYQREQTGEGSFIDVSMMDTLFSVMENFVMEYTMDGKTPHRAGNQDPSIAPFDSFSGKDGDFVMGCGTNAMFAALVNEWGKPELIQDPRFASNYARCENYSVLKPLLNEWFKTMTVEHIGEMLIRLQIPFGNILTIPEAAEHEQIRSRNMLWEVYQPGMDSTIEIPGSPIKIHGHEDKCHKASPQLGEDNVEILKGIGFSDEKITEYKEKGIV